MVPNPKAGRAAPEKVRAALAAAFEPAGLRWQVFEPSEGEIAPDSIRHGVERAVRDGFRLVVAAGGDGTVSMTGDALIQAPNGSARVPLGIIPLGTANILAHELRVPLDPGAAILLLVGDHRLVEIDAMEQRGHHYFTQIGAGPDALMIEETWRETHKKRGRLAYIIALLRRASGHRSQVFRILVDGRPVRLRGWEVVLANAKTLGVAPFVWGPHVDPSDGMIDLCVYNVRGPRDYLRALWTLIARRHLLDPNARFFRVRESAALSCARPLPVQADGESVGETPIEVRVVPRAIRVLAPAGMLSDLRTGWHAVLEVVPPMWLTSLTVNYPIKALLRRHRPFVKHEEAIVVGTRPTDPSFPSGHSAAAFAGALLLSFQYPGWSPLFYLLALVVGFSRIYLGVHFPLDVAMGAVTGMVLAAAYSALLHLIFPGLGG